MKKLLSISLFLAFTFAACIAYAQKPAKQAKQINQKPLQMQADSRLIEDKKSLCWEITGPNGYREYRWDNKANVQQWVAEMRSQHNETYEYTTCNHSTIEACDASNEKINPKKCWKITGVKGGQTTEQYVWATETVARRKATALKAEGYQQTKYEMAAINDEKSCHASATNTNPNEPACWKIKIGNNITYMWGYERDAQATVNAAINSGQTASYELSPNKTKDSCQ